MRPSAGVPQLTPGDWRTVPAGPERPFQVSFRWERDQRGESVLTEIVVQAQGGRLRVRDLVHARLQQLALSTLEPARPTRREPLKLIHPGPRGYPQWHYRQVAERWLFELSRPGPGGSGAPPTRALAADYQVTPQTVRSWVRRCRAMGLLP